VITVTVAVTHHHHHQITTLSHSINAIGPTVAVTDGNPIEWVTESVAAAAEVLHESSGRRRRRPLVASTIMMVAAGGMHDGVKSYRHLLPAAEPQQYFIDTVSADGS
jgi:hypothetical protein